MQPEYTRAGTMLVSNEDWFMTPNIQQTWVWCHEQSGGTGNCKVVKLLQFLPREVQNWQRCHSKTQNEKKPDQQQVHDFCYAHERAQVTGQPTGPKSGEGWAPGESGKRPALAFWDRMQPDTRRRVGLGWLVNQRRLPGVCWREATDMGASAISWRLFHHKPHRVLTE